MSINKVMLYLSLVIAMASFAADKQMKPRMGISPSKIEVELDEKGASESITVLNVSDKDLEIQVTVANWELDKNNKIKILPPEEHSLDRWIIVNPLRFTIPAGESQTVRFAIRPRAQPQQGEHKAMIYFTEIVKEELGEPQSFRISFKFGVPVYAYVGEKVSEGRLLDSTVESHGPRQMKAKFRIINDGNANIRLAGRYAVWRRGEYPGELLASAWIEKSVGVEPKHAREGMAEKAVVENEMVESEDEQVAEPVIEGLVRLTPVFPGNDRWIDMLFQKPESGAYHMLVVGEIAGKPVLRNLEFTR